MGPAWPAWLLQAERLRVGHRCLSLADLRPIAAAISAAARRSVTTDVDSDRSLKIDKLLIANRGEIACRVMQTAHRLGKALRHQHEACTVLCCMSRTAAESVPSKSILIVMLATVCPDVSLKTDCSMRYQCCCICESVDHLNASHVSPTEKMRIVVAMHWLQAFPLWQCTVKQIGMQHMCAWHSKHFALVPQLPKRATCRRPGS